MRYAILLAVAVALAGCQSSLGTGGWQIGLGSGAQQCDEPLTCRLDCERQEVQTIGD